MDQTSKIQLDKIGEMFDEGKRFTEEVLKENERLRLVVQNQKREIKELSHGPSIEIKELRARIEILEEDNRLLREDSLEIRRQYDAVDQTNKEYRERYKYIEQQNSSLLNLYVAAQRLHEKLEFIEVIQAIKELVVSLIGADSFEICLYDERAKRLSVLATEGSSTGLGSAVPLLGPITHVLQTGTVYIPYITDRMKYDPPLLACIPLKLEEETRGTLIIRSLLYQKEWFDGSEQELFDLLSGQAMTALCASFSYSQNFSENRNSQWPEIFSEMTEAAKRLENVDLVPAVIW
jgi:hypothetical protein